MVGNHQQWLPVTAVIPTRQRAQSLKRTLDSLFTQDSQPVELVIVDGSAGDETRRVVEEFRSAVSEDCRVLYLRAQELGAAPQRNQGIEAASQSTIWFMDDDILFEPQCVSRLWAALNSSVGVGGASATITNQGYHPPGRISKLIYRLMDGKPHSYAGRVLGPAINILPEDSAELPDIVSLEWLNTGCTMYRREALPCPVFASHFTGYSLMEDLTLSLQVGKSWQLVNARTARIFHDSQPGSHKSDVVELSAMELINRHFIMVHLLNRTSFMDYMKLFIWEACQVAATARNRSSRRQLGATIRGKVNAVIRLMSEWSGKTV